MPWNFADGFDLYSQNTDAQGYYDATSNFYGPGLPAGRFPGSMAMQWYGSGYFNKQNNGQNDGVHHFVMAILGQNPPTGGGVGLYVTLYDGTTAQCAICIMSNGDIQLRAGGPTGATLALYAAAFTTQNVWYAFEFEVQIHNTLGMFNVRKNGNGVNDFSLSGLNTRATANNYANGIQMGLHSSANYQMIMDDFYWRSAVSGVAWMGDLRCFTRTPKSDVQAQFAPSGVRRASDPGFGGNGCNGNWAFYSSYIMPCDGKITGVAFYFSVYHGNVKLALYTDNVTNPGRPGTLLAAATSPVAPGGAFSGYANFTISPAITTTNGTILWTGICFDVDDGPARTLGQNVAGQPPGWYNSSTPYSTFPAGNNPTPLTTNQNLKSDILIAPANSGCVNELPNDALTTYLYDANIGDNDLYTINPITATPSNILAVRTVGMMRKSDAGGRSGAMQLNSGGLIVASPSISLNNNAWSWASRLDILDPNTGAQWTPAAVDALQIGPKVAS